MPRYVSTSKDVGSVRTGPKNAKEAIAAQSNAKRAAANNASPPRKNPSTGRLNYGYGGGPLTQNKGSFNTRSGGYQDAAKIGYTPGGFDDPNIDWQGIYNAFIAPTLNTGGGGVGAVGGGSPNAQSVYEAPAAVSQMPAEFQAPAAVQPIGQIGEAASSDNAPTGTTFESFGGPGTFGEFNRLRNARGPRYNASMTPEMLRRAAASRL